MEKTLQYDLEKIIKSRCDEIGLEYVEPEPLLKEEIQSIIEKRCDELGLSYKGRTTEKTQDTTKHASPAKRVTIRRRIKKTHTRNDSFDSNVHSEKSLTIVKSNTDEEDENEHWKRMIEKRRQDNMADLKSSQLKTH